MNLTQSVIPAFGSCSAPGITPGEAKEPKVQGSRINNSCPKDMNLFFNIKDTTLLNKGSNKVLSPSGLNFLSWVPGLRIPNARPSHWVSKPGMTPRGKFILYFPTHFRAVRYSS